MVRNGRLLYMIPLLILKNPPTLTLAIREARGKAPCVIP
jgi:hypothetical protein